MIESILPANNATPWEKAVEATSAARHPIPAHLVRDVWDSDRCPEHLLPYLAASLSVDIWDNAWPVEKKRDVVARSIDLHRRKGTLSGIRDHIRIAGGELVAARVPPDIFYPDPAETKAEREAYLSKFQQLRVYDFRSGGTATYGAFTCGAFLLSKTFPGGGPDDNNVTPTFFPYATDAPARVGKQAYLYEPLDGTEVPLKRIERTVKTEARFAVDFEEFALSGSAPFGFFCDGGPRDKLYTYDAGSAARTYSMRIDRAYDHRTDVRHLTAYESSLEPIDVRPERVATAGERVYGQLFPGIGGKATEFFTRADDDPLFKVFLPESSAYLRLYSRLFLFDPARRPAGRNARSFAGYVRLGMPAYHARITVELTGTISPFAFGRFGAGFIVETSKKKLDDVVKAAASSKSLRDVVLLTSRTHRPARAGDRLKVGSIKAGDWIRDVS